MFRLDDCVAYVSSNSMKRISEKFNDILCARGTTRVQWIALYYLDKNNGLTQSELSRLMNIKKPTTVRLIDRLEREGLVQREGGVDDKRIITVRCTDKGKEVNNQMLPVGDSFSKAITQGLSDEELDFFKKVLTKLESNLKDIEKKI